MQELLSALTKRRSIRKTESNLPLTQADLAFIKKTISQLEPLFKDIKVDYRILKREETDCNFGEYVLAIYSEKKENYLLNVGYMFEQLDLILCAHNIGVCWYGWGGIKEEVLPNGLEYVIKMTLMKCEEQDYIRATPNRDTSFWEGEHQELFATCKLSPSAHNSQPWRIKADADTINVSRYISLMSSVSKLLTYFNKIDMGIFLCCLEVSMQDKWTRTIYPETNKKEHLVTIAQYKRS
ncbi:MAG: nitroreductase family protein [Bacilli bacterium]|nr:nitroreductase family protein [Bacilli bacterium]MDD4065513.1 nitroreductase family protein [Bacilli bacterium]